MGSIAFAICEGAKRGRPTSWRRAGNRQKQGQRQPQILHFVQDDKTVLGDIRSREEGFLALLAFTMTQLLTGSFIPYCFGRTSNVMDWAGKVAVMVAVVLPVGGGVMAMSGRAVMAARLATL